MTAWRLPVRPSPRSCPSSGVSPYSTKPAPGSSLIQAITAERTETFCTYWSRAEGSAVPKTRERAKTEDASTTAFVPRLATRTTRLPRQRRLTLFAKHHLPPSS